MATRNEKKSAASAEERFLLQSLRRLHSSGQRYIFTLIVDLISHGLAATKSRAKKSPGT